MSIVLYGGIGLILYCWVGYPVLMAILAAMRRPASFPVGSAPPTVTVMIAAFNEASNLEARIQNIFDCDWEGADLEILVVSDGSTDDTCDLVRSIGARDDRVRLLEVNPQRGRANAHNEGTRIARGDILVFSDAETVFAPKFLEEISAPFADTKVGFASGSLDYANDQEGVAHSAGLYWRQEQALRRAESTCGIFILGSGACCAVRRNLFRDVPPTGDIDFTTPLDVVLQGSRCIHCPDAIAHDVLPDTTNREFRARIRMTSKNLRGTISRWGLKGLLGHPVYSLVLLSHKILKWLTPFLALVVLASSLTLAMGSSLAMTVLIAQVAFLAWAVVGRWCPRLLWAGHAWNFLMVNIAFGIGVGKALLGGVPAMYRPVSQTSR